MPHIPYISDEEAHKSLMAELIRLKVTNLEVNKLIRLLQGGHMNGSTCSRCILGSLGHIRGVTYNTLSEGPDENQHYKDFEYWLMNGGPGGGIPTNREKVATLDRWLSQWQEDYPDINR